MNTWYGDGQFGDSRVLFYSTETREPASGSCLSSSGASFGLTFVPLGFPGASFGITLGLLGFPGAISKPRPSRQKEYPGDGLQNLWCGSTSFNVSCPLTTTRLSSAICFVCEEEGRGVEPPAPGSHAPVLPRAVAVASHSLWRLPGLMLCPSAQSSQT